MAVFKSTPVTKVINGSGDSRTLNQIPNAGDVDIAGFNLKNISCDPQHSLDAVNVCFLWKVLNEGVQIEWQ